MKRRLLFFSARLLVTVLGCIGAFAAEGSPKRHVTLIVPYTSGSTPDIVARAVAPQFGEGLGVPVVVENRAGAGGNVAAQYLVAKEPDGYTLMIAPIAVMAINKWLFKSLPFDPEKDFTPINNLVGIPNILVVRPGLQVSNLPELITMAKRHPDEMFYGSSGPGTSLHLCMEMIKSDAGIRMTHVPYGGVSAALVDLVEGRINVVCSNMPPVLPLIRDGRLTGLAVTSRARHPLVKNMPTVAESGIPGFESIAWVGIAGPAGIEKPMVTRLQRAVSRALTDPVISKRLVSMGLTILNDGPEEFSRFIAAESIKWRKTIADAGLTGQQ